MDNVGKLLEQLTDSYRLTYKEVREDERLRKPPLVALGLKKV
jgi:hypothetical protein